MKDNPINDFWIAFATEAKTLRQKVAAGDLRDTFGRIDALLEEHGLDFCFELTEEGQDAVLVLTPEGDKAQAIRIDRLVEAMPKITGWRVFGRRRRKPLDDAFAFVNHIYGLNVNEATFDVEETVGGCVVTMWSDAIRGLSNEEAQGLIETFLDHAVGEEVVMSSVAQVVGRFLGKGHLSAAELVRTLENRTAKGPRSN